VSACSSYYFSTTCTLCGTNTIKRSSITPQT
jgi:hypothetical protein